MRKDEKRFANTKKFAADLRIIKGSRRNAGLAFATASLLIAVTSFLAFSAAFCPSIIGGFTGHLIAVIIMCGISALSLTGVGVVSILDARSKYSELEEAFSQVASVAYKNIRRYNREVNAFNDECVEAKRSIKKSLIWLPMYLSLGILTGFAASALVTMPLFAPVTFASASLLITALFAIVLSEILGAIFQFVVITPKFFRHVEKEYNRVIETALYNSWKTMMRNGDISPCTICEDGNCSICGYNV